MLCLLFPGPLGNRVCLATKTHLQHSKRVIIHLIGGYSTNDWTVWTLTSMVYPLAIPQNTSLATSKSQSPPRNKANWKRKKSIVPVPATLVVSRLVLRGYGLASSPQLHRSGGSWQIIQQGGTPKSHGDSHHLSNDQLVHDCGMVKTWFLWIVDDCGHPTIMHDMI